MQRSTLGIFYKSREDNNCLLKISISKRFAVRQIKWHNMSVWGHLHLCTSTSLVGGNQSGFEARFLSTHITPNVVINLLFRPVTFQTGVFESKSNCFVSLSFRILLTGLILLQTVSSTKAIFFFHHCYSQNLMDWVVVSLRPIPLSQSLWINSFLVISRVTSSPKLIYLNCFRDSLSATVALLSTLAWWSIDFINNNINILS